MNALVPRATVEALVARRNAALQLFETAYRSIEDAHGAVEAAHRSLREAAPLGKAYVSERFEVEDERRMLLSGFAKPERAAFMARARRNLDVTVWDHLVKITNLEMLMDKTAKDEMRRGLASDPPEVTEGNVYATLERFAADADMIWKRGVAESFSKLDRRFRSHDGWKLGSRVILSYVFDENGYWCHSSRHRDTLIDIERAFAVLDGNRGETHYQGIADAVDEARRGKWGARQTEVTSEYFLVRAFKNGNVHLWFRRPDLVTEVNKVLASYYGEVTARFKTLLQEIGGAETLLACGDTDFIEVASAYLRSIDEADRRLALSPQETAALQAIRSFCAAACGVPLVYVRLRNASP